MLSCGRIIKTNSAKTNNQQSTINNQQPTINNPGSGFRRLGPVWPSVSYRCLIHGSVTDVMFRS